VSPEQLPQRSKMEKLREQLLQQKRDKAMAHAAQVGPTPHASARLRRLQAQVQHCTRSPQWGRRMQG